MTDPTGDAIRANLKSEYEKGWNAAIEKAAEEVRMCTTGNWVLPLLEQIRKLKII